ncbi:MAG: DUF2157 domain-containing protein [Lentisphaerae bacterium]|nr:DUF2157 domain-containing protein [Lentisphaerota bacterium]
MGFREIQWLKREMAAWEREGVVDAAVTERLRARYAVADASATSWGRLIFSSLGALLVGLGIIALLAANWGDLGRDARALIAFMPLGACAALVLAGHLRGWRSRVFLEPLGLFWGLAVGSGLALLGQTYHLPQDAESFTLVWTLLLIPVCYATRALAPVAGFFVGLLTWVSMSQLSGGVGLLYWPLAELVAPLIDSVRREPEAETRSTWMLWAAAMSCTAALGVTLEKSLPGLWMIIYTGAFSVLLLGGEAYGRDARGWWRNPLRTLGGGGLAVVLVLLIFRWPWEDVGWNHWRADLHHHRWAAIFDFSLAIALPVAAAFLLVLAFRRAPRRRWHGVPLLPAWALWGAAPVVTAAAYAWAASGGHDQWPALLMALYLAGLGLATLGEGLAGRRPGTINLGVLVLLAVIIGKFLSSDAEFAAKGVAFIACGGVFLAANMAVSRRMSKKGGAA